MQIYRMALRDMLVDKMNVQAPVALPGALVPPIQTFTAFATSVPCQFNEVAASAAVSSDVVGTNSVTHEILTLLAGINQGFIVTDADLAIAVRITGVQRVRAQGNIETYFVLTGEQIVDGSSSGNIHQNDWISWIQREDITLQSLLLTSDSDAYTDHALAAAGGACKRREISTNEVIASNGTYTRSNIVWLIPRSVLPVGVIPTARYRIKDAAGQTYSIIDVSLSEWGDHYKCITVME